MVKPSRVQKIRTAYIQRRDELAGCLAEADFKEVY